MAYFEWADGLVIDGGPFDADHRQLIALVNALHTTTSEGRGVEVIDDVLKKVVAYTLGHLQREEALMSSVLRGWLSLHIRRSDKELKVYLAEPRLKSDIPSDARKRKAR